MIAVVPKTSSAADHCRPTTVGVGVPTLFIATRVTAGRTVAMTLRAPDTDTVRRDHEHPDSR